MHIYHWQGNAWNKHSALMNIIIKLWQSDLILTIATKFKLPNTKMHPCTYYAKLSY